MLEYIRHLLHYLFDVEGLVRAAGPNVPWVVSLIVFVETGFFVGFFLPGDSLLVTAGVFSAAGVVALKWLLLPVMLCAIVGDQIGYWIGRVAGAALYRREDSLFFKRRHLQRAHDFYEKYGGKTVIMARFVPIIRTFCPPVAGAAGDALRNLSHVRHLWWRALGRDDDPGRVLSRAFHSQYQPENSLRNPGGHLRIAPSGIDQFLERPTGGQECR